MPRQLNPHLFRSQGNENPQGESRGRLSQVAFVGGESSSISDSRMEKMESELLQQKRRIHELHQFVEKLTTHMQERLGAERSKSEKLGQSMENLEAKYKYLVKESNAKIAELAGRINERRTTDLKIEELIDRQNSVIRGFESRLNQMQRLISEKENHLARSAASLNEAKMEIMRLKRLI